MRYGHSAQAPTLAKMSQALRSLVLLTPKDVVNLIASAILIHSFEGALNGADGPQQSQNLFPRRNFCSFFAFSLSLAYDNHGATNGQHGA
jgi:hypothetical protein